MSGNMQRKLEHIFDRLMPVTALISREYRDYYIFSMCRYAQSCAFISVIELPRIPAYCPKLKKQVAKFRETVYTKDRSKCLPLADGAGYK